MFQEVQRKVPPYVSVDASNEQVLTPKQAFVKHVLTDITNQVVQHRKRYTTFKRPYNPM